MVVFVVVKVLWSSVWYEHVHGMAAVDKVFDEEAEV